MSDAVAKLRFGRTAPRKIRYVADQIRGLAAAEALTLLAFSKRGAALSLARLLKSALANAEDKGGLDLDNLFVKTLTVDGGPTLKRWRPRAHGRATRIRKRTSHVTLILGER